MLKMRTVIGGREYNLKSSDEKLLKACAEIVDKEMTLIQEKMPNESTVTISILTALNIAEKYYQLIEQSNIDNEFLRRELKKMAEQLEINSIS